MLILSWERWCNSISRVETWGYHYHDYINITERSFMDPLNGKIGHISLFGVLVSGACAVFLVLSHVTGFIINACWPNSPLSPIKWDDLGVGIGIAVGCGAYMF